MIAKLSGITRIVLTDEAGRNYEANNVNISVDADDKTLKVFVEPRAYWAGSKPKPRKLRRRSS